MAKKTINVQSVPLVSDPKGNTVSSNVSGSLFEMKTMIIDDPETGESREVQIMAPTKAETVSYSHKAPEEEAYLKIKSLQPVEGSVLKFKLQDSPHQTCPDKLPIGEFTLLKGYDFQLEFSDKEITFSETGIPDNLEWNNKLYPPYPPNKFKKQRELLWYIINRRAFYSDFIWHKLEHPPELQKSLNIKSLMEKKRQLLEEQEKQNREYQNKFKSIEKELRQTGVSFKDEKTSEIIKQDV